jgi:membrane dipeptidase
MRLTWRDLGTPRADRAAGRPVELTGFPLTVLLPAGGADHFLMMAEPGCCAGCVPNNPLAVVEVLTDKPLKVGSGPLRLCGTWQVSSDPDGWRYQLQGAEVKPGVTRRALMAASPLFCLPVPAMAQVDGTAVDIHSHADNLIRASFGRDSLLDVVGPMRKGGMSVICLAIVADSPIIQVSSGRNRPSRDPRPGELYDWSKTTFAKLHELVRGQAMPIVKTAADLRAARASQPSVIVTSEGGDFLEGKIERLEEAYQRWQLRHLQLTHYRPNELGDIQTEPAVHGGLTNFGVEVIRRCNQLGIVVDLAHGTLDLVKRAVASTTKPLVLSHTGLLSNQGNPWTRFITTEHARAVASVRGVIGVWPVTQAMTLQSYADSIARMVDAVGVDYVAVGTDQMGLTGASAMPSYNDLPQLAALLRSKFTPDETAKILGGNYRRVFEASLA